MAYFDAYKEGLRLFYDFPVIKFVMRVTIILGILFVVWFVIGWCIEANREKRKPK